MYITSVARLALYLVVESRLEAPEQGWCRNTFAYNPAEIKVEITEDLRKSVTLGDRQGKRASYRPILAA